MERLTQKNSSLRAAQPGSQVRARSFAAAETRGGTNSSFLQGIDKVMRDHAETLRELSKR